MAFRMSDRDKAAIQAAAAIRQSNQAQADYDALMPQAMAKISQAQQGPSNPLESVLSGIGNSVKNVGTGLMDLFGTGGAAFGDLAESIRTGKATTKNQDDYRKWLYNTDSLKDAAAKGLGTGLDAAATLTDFIPGLGAGAKAAINVGQGVASGIANPLIEKGSQATLEDAMKGALVGGASAGVGQYVGGKLANRAAGKGLVSKALNSNVGKGAITGGLAGAAGGGLYAGLNGGDVIGGALQGAQGGAMAGGTMAGTMGLIGSGIDRLNRKYNATPQTPDVPTSKPIVDEVAEQYTKPATIETALQEAQPQVQAQPIQETLAQMPVQRVRRAADTSDIKINPNLAPEDVARLERQLTVNRQKQGAALLEQYGTLDAPVRRAVGSPEDVLTTLYDDYGLKTPADVQYAANHVTGRDGVVSKMTRELAASANNVDTTITRDWLQELMDANGLLDDEQKTVTKQIAGALKRANVDSDGATTLDIMKQLEKQSARYKGKDGTYHHATEAETRKGIILDLVHDELQDRLWDAAGDPKKVLTPKRITELKSMYKDNDAWANFIDNRLAKSKSGAELRSAMKPLVDGSKIVYGSKQSAGGFADRAYKAATSANPVVAMGQMAYDAALDSDKVKQIRASRYAKDAAKAKAQLTGQETPKGNGLIGTAKNIGQKAVNKAGKAAEMLNNGTVYNARLGGNKGDAYNMPSQGEFMTRQLSRQAGLGAMQQQDRQNAIQNATQEAQDIQSNYENSMLQAQQAYNQAQQTQNSIPSTLDRIGAGMERALAAGDINAYSTLASLYKQAAQIYELQNPTTTKSEAKALTNSQSKAMTGLQQLQTLSGMTPDLGTALASSPLGGLVNMAGGNDYANQAEALATTIGYLLSGATIKPEEAEKLGRGYVPSAYDSDQVRQKKLSRAEQLLRNYLADTSALPQ